MKYIIVLGDGMADEPIDSLNNMTPLEYAKTPTLDCLSKKSEVGLLNTIPEGMSPGSDTANLSVLGYDPKRYYSGRSPLEALSIGVQMKSSDVAIRCNFVTITQNEGDLKNQVMIDHSADEISTSDCRVLLDTIQANFTDEEFQFYLGTSYQHCLIWNQGLVTDLTPPHDILGKEVKDYLPKEDKLLKMMEKSYQLLRDHPLNLERVKQGKNPANCCWFWGAGTKPSLQNFEVKTGKRGMMISAVDLLKGIAIGAGMSTVNIEGANGGLHTNYAGKTSAALKALLEDGYDFVYLHIEAADEMGHQGSVERKVQAIEWIDEKVLAPLVAALDESEEDYRLLVLPDHPTPIRIRTHTSDPVPYLLYDNTVSVKGTKSYCEKSAKETDIYIEYGYKMIDKLFEKN